MTLAVTFKKYTTQADGLRACFIDSAHGHAAEDKPGGCAPSSMQITLLTIRSLATPAEGHFTRRTVWSLGFSRQSQAHLFPPQPLEVGKFL